MARMKPNIHGKPDRSTEQVNGVAGDEFGAADEPLEVTYENHLTMTSRGLIHLSTGVNSSDHKSGFSRITKLLGSRSLHGTSGRNGKDDFTNHFENNEIWDGNRSVNSATNHTIGSFETIKISNANKLDQRHRLLSTNKKDDKNNRWNSLKRIIRVKTAPWQLDDSVDSFTIRYSQACEEKKLPSRQRAQTEDSRHEWMLDRRVQSSPDRRFASSDRSKKLFCVVSPADQDVIDDNIRGRFYGVDVLFLGDGRFTTSVATSSAPWDTPFLHSFTGQTPQWSPQQIVDDMLFSSLGREKPEMLLDGVIPGPDGRWLVQLDLPLEILSVQKNSTNRFDVGTKSFLSSRNSLHTVSNNSKNPTVDLQSSIWGSEAPPLQLADSGSQSDEDVVHTIASRCSIPIDIDDDSFIITSPEHVHALHTVIGFNLAKGQFEDACNVLKTVLRGISSSIEPDLRFFKGSTLHNLGVIQLCQTDQRRNAVASFQKAIHERQKLLPPMHPDIITSLVRKAAACFALGDFKESISALENALILTPPDHLIRAKVLNNLGVVYYFYRGGKPALKEFINSLALQRRWLETTIRRESTIYDAAVSLCNMGKVYLELSEFDLSFRAYEEALLMLTSIFSKDHDMVLNCLSSLAIAKSQKGDLAHALQILHGCLRSQNRRFGEMSPASIETIGLIGYLHAKNGELNAALKYLTTVRKWQKTNLHAQHPSLLKTKESLKMLENRLGINRSSSVAKVWI